jgi:peroxiredoxin
MALAYGAADDDTASYPKRYTFVIGPDGTVNAAINTQDPGGQANLLLEHL